MNVVEPSIHKIYTMVAGPDGRAIGNKDVCEYRFVPRIGEHILFPEGDTAHIYEVIDVRHTPKGDFEVWVVDLGDHGDFVPQV